MLGKNPSNYNHTNIHPTLHTMPHILSLHLKRCNPLRVYCYSFSCPSYPWFTFPYDVIYIDHPIFSAPTNHCCFLFK